MFTDKLALPIDRDRALQSDQTLMIADVINYLVVGYCRKHHLLYFPMRSTRLKNPLGLHILEVF